MFQYHRPQSSINLHLALMFVSEVMTQLLCSDVVLETQVLVSRRLETHFLSLGLGLGLGLEPSSLGLGLVLDPSLGSKTNTRFELLCN